MKTAMNLAVCAAVTAGTLTANAQTITWKSPGTYANGYAPAVAMSETGLGWMVEEHSASDCGIYCSSQFWSGAANWLTGWFPSAYGLDSGGSGLNRLAGDAGSGSTFFVETHEPYTTTDYGQYAWYRTGYLNTYTGTVAWNNSHAGISNATQLSIAQGNNINFASTTFVAVNSQYRTSGSLPLGPDGKLYYETGTLNGDDVTITWSGSSYIEDGQHPSVAMLTNGSQFFVIEVHEDFSGNLWYRTGTVAPAGGGTINWVSVAPYDRGSRPSIAICSNPGGSSPAVVEVHQGGPGTVWYHTGYINTAANTITFGDSHQLSVPSAASGPSVACGGHDGVVVYGTGSSPNYTSTLDQFTLN